MRFTSVLAVAVAMALVVSSLSGSVGGRRMTEELWKAARRDQAEVDARGVDQGEPGWWQPSAGRNTVAGVPLDMSKGGGYRFD